MSVCGRHCPREEKAQNELGGRLRNDTTENQCSWDCGVVGKRAKVTCCSGCAPKRRQQVSILLRAADAQSCVVLKGYDFIHLFCIFLPCRPTNMTMFPLVATNIPADSPHVGGNFASWRSSSSMPSFFPFTSSLCIKVTSLTL